MSKRRSEQEPDNVTSWELSGLTEWEPDMDFELSGLADWTDDIPVLKLSGLYISPAELQPGYNDKQEAAGRAAWELLEKNSNCTPAESGHEARTKQRGSKEKVKRK